MVKEIAIPLPTFFCNNIAFKNWPAFLLCSRLVINLKEIPVWENVDYDCFHNEIVPLNQPAVIKSLVSDWPLVKAANKSASSAVDYLKPFDKQASISALVGAPEINGRFFYNDNLTDLNFKHAKVTLSVGLDRLLAIKNNSKPHAIILQTPQLGDVMPDFQPLHHQPLLKKSTNTNMWVGNRAVVAPHYDIYDNLACVAAGSRKFTLFPPDQINNLYPGPILSTPAGVPISLVDIRDPDLKQFPKYIKALDVGFEATLDIGDAIFVPALWWRGIESLKSFNILFNYIWESENKQTVSPQDSLLHGMLSIANLDEAKRHAWQQFFEYYVFKTKDEPSDHLPNNLKDITTGLSLNEEAGIRKFLAEMLIKLD